MRVLIVPEDFRYDQYILKPLFLRLFRDIGKPRARVEICRDPLLGGFGEALKSQRIAQILGQHGGMIDIFILCVDRDGSEGRRQRLDQIESEFGTARTLFFAENAWEEVVTWMLAGLNLPADWSWRDVRAEVKVKEQYFEPLAARLGLTDTPGGGRDELGREAARRLGAIRQKCPQDFDALARRLEAAIQ